MSVHVNRVVVYNIIRTSGFSISDSRNARPRVVGEE